MKGLRMSRAAAAFLGLLSWAFGGCGPAGIEIHAAGGAYEITVAPSKVVLTLPKGDWAPSGEGKEGAAANPTYFSLEDLKKGLSRIRWLEPAERYSGLKPLWEGDCKAWKEHGAPQPLNVTFTKIGEWEAVLYELPMPKGVSNTHIRAEWTGQGTWIDAHMSLTSTLGTADARKRIHEVFDGIRVKSKQPS